MYKWFIWSDKLQKYLPCSGLSLYSRAIFPASITDYFGNEVPVSFSIPMFNAHNAVKP